MLWLSALVSICFLGGWLSPFNTLLPDSFVWLILKTLVVCFAIIKVRANYPRYRYDQLMNLGWKVFLPFSIGYFLFVASILVLL